MAAVGLRVCILGTGAVGTLLAAALADGGAAVSALGRGASAAALAAGRMRLSRGGGGVRPLPAIGPPDPAQPPPDILLTAVKAHQLAGALAEPRVRAVLAAAPVVVTALNGLPFWYARGLADPRLALPLATVDPHGTLAAATAGRAVGGAVLTLAAERVAADVVAVAPGPAVALGDPDGAGGAAAAGLDRLAAALAAGGVDAAVTADIRLAVWQKLWGNAVLNPVTGLTGLGVGPASLDGAAVVLPALAEVQAVAAGLGGHRSSMLQDLEAGRPTEIDAVTAAVAELGARLGVATPVLDTLAGLVRLREGRSG